MFPVPLPRMVAPYAAIPKSVAEHRHQILHTGYQRLESLYRSLCKIIKIRGGSPPDEVVAKSLFLVTAMPGSASGTLLTGSV